MIVVYRGKHCPVSKNYLASLQQIIFELVDLGVEVVAVSGDGRERADAFVSPPCCTHVGCLELLGTDVQRCVAIACLIWPHMMAVVAPNV